MAELAEMKCLIIVKRDMVNKKLALSIMQLPNNYQIKEMLVWQKDSLLLLMSTLEELSEERPHGILGYIDTGSINSVTFDDQGTNLNIMDLIYANSDVSLFIGGEGFV